MDTCLYECTSRKVRKVSLKADESSPRAQCQGRDRNHFVKRTARAVEKLFELCVRMRTSVRAHLSPPIESLRLCFPRASRTYTLRSKKILLTWKRVCVIMDTNDAPDPQSAICMIQQEGAGASRRHLECHIWWTHVYVFDATMDIASSSLARIL